MSVSQYPHILELHMFDGDSSISQKFDGTRIVDRMISRVRSYNQDGDIGKVGEFTSWCDLLDTSEVGVRIYDHCLEVCGRLNWR